MHEQTDLRVGGCALTIIVLTFNEEANITNCLNSFAGVSAPIFVVDSGSTDKTLDLLAERDVTVVQHPFSNYAAQRNWAQANVPWATEWVLHLDAGEVCLPAFTQWLQTGFDPSATTVDGYLVARRAVFMGKWIRYGGYHPIYHLRLFRRHLGRCEAKVYDQHFVCNGKTTTVPRGADLADGVMANLREFTVTHARWAVFEAIEALRSEVQSGEVSAKFFGSPIERRRWMKINVFERVPILMRSILYFFDRYFVKLGILDGVRGLIFHSLQGLWFRFLVDSIIYEVRRELDGDNLDEVVLRKYGIDAGALLVFAEEPTNEV